MTNKFQIGDKVQVLDDTIEGIVKKITNNLIYIETLDGFDIEFNEKELIKIEPSNPEINFNKGYSQVMAEKEPPSKKKNPFLQTNKNNHLIFEIDLHIEKLMGGKKGNLSNFDLLTIQLEEAKKSVDYAIQKKYQRIVLIHGVGEGVLKSELEFMLRRYENVTISEGNFSKYGMGAMEIYIKQN